MKKVLLSLSLASMILSSCQKISKEETGDRIYWRNTPWSTKCVKECKDPDGIGKAYLMLEKTDSNFEKVGTDGLLEIYKRCNEVKQVGEVKVDSVRYFTFNRNLYMVKVFYDDSNCKIQSYYKQWFAGLEDTSESNIGLITGNDIIFSDKNGNVIKNNYYFESSIGTKFRCYDIVTYENLRIARKISEYKDSLEVSKLKKNTLQ